MRSKHLITALSLVLLFAFSACNQESSSKKIEAVSANDGDNSSIIRMPVTGEDLVEDPKEAAQITFEEEVFDFGTVKEGEIVEHTFTFTNTGKIPLVISEARATCGCTVPEWPKDPIEPGGKSEIRVKFDTNGKKDKQSKPVTITANTYPAQTQVLIFGFVEGKEVN